MLSSLGSRLGLGSLCAAFSLFCGDHSVTHHPSLPPSYPLAVRNPYLSAWMPSDQVQNLPYSEPQFWAGQSLAWAIIARVDDQAYSLMGVPNPSSSIRPAVVHRAEYTATHTVFTLSAGSVTFELDFLSPVSPSNHLRQSLPFSYLTVTMSGAASNDIQIYSDIDGRWTGQSEYADWAFHKEGPTAMYSMDIKDVDKYSENHDMALWGQAILASRSSKSKLSSASGASQKVRSQFAEDGKLAGDEDWTGDGVVAMSHDLGRVTGGRSVNFAVGYVREEAINYLGDAYTGYYRAQYPKTFDAVSYFLDDYHDASQESAALDSELSTKAKASAGQKYSDIVALSTRQAFGGIDITIPNDSRETSQVLAFIKELSSNGNLNTVDVIMPAFPVYFVFNPDYIRLLLEPMMKYLAAGRWHQPYTIHDMGTHYPNAIGHDDQRAEPMPIEECGNLLVLALAYTRATGDTNWSTQYTHIMRGYADYLIENGVDIANQLSSNDAAGPLPNETNLAIKAAVGIKAFGELTGLEEYSRIGNERADLFFTHGLGTDDEKTHFVLEYPDMPSSWKTPYNLYPDVLLNLETFPNAAYDMGNAFFSSPSVRGEYGVPLDDRQDWAKSDWNMWLAGTLNVSTRDEFVDDLWAFMTNGQHNWPFSDRYVARSRHDNVVGIPILCRARPTVGGHFALLALQGSNLFKSLSQAGLADEMLGMEDSQVIMELHGEEL